MSEYRSFIVEIYPKNGPMIEVQVTARDYAHARQVARATYSDAQIGSVREVG